MYPDVGSLTFVACVVGVLTLAYCYVTRHFQYWTSRGVFSPRPIPFFGSIKRLLLQNECPGEFLANVYKEGVGHPCVGIFLMDKPALVIRDPEWLKHILIKDFDYFMDRYAETDPKVDPLAMKSFFMGRGKKTRDIRALIRPVFSSGRIKSMFYLVKNCAMEMESCLVEMAKGLKAVEVKELMAKTNTDVVASCAFGINSNTIRDPNAEFREFGKKTFVYTFRRCLESNAVFFLPWLAKLVGFTFFHKGTTKFFRKVFWDTVNAQEENNIVRHDMMDLFIRLKNKGNIYDEDGIETQSDSDKLNCLDGDDLVAQASLFFLAGFESTSSTVAFSLYELAIQPNLQTRLRQEVHQVLARHDGQITYNAVQDMKFLDMVVLETLRKYPPLPFLDRVCCEDYNIPGTSLTIVKGTPIYVPLMGLHYDPEYFPEPDLYDPERFSEERKHKYPTCIYLPFGEGRRICIGMRFGLIAVKTELAHVINRMEVLPCSQTPIPLVLNRRSTVLETLGGIPLVFREINENS